ncbi:MAG: hypothetical protein SFV15_05165 [Polyangiaceae bacterium]|nr:hypothetical protein [Polyangiaceae bacterium]
MTSRLNARMDQELARKVKYLRERTGSSTTGVIIASIEAFYTRFTQSEEPGVGLREFVGCADGPSDLSSNYKEALLDSLANKHSSSKKVSKRKSPARAQRRAK